ncbi:hypothetical protein Tco_1527798 [Tanacetum coccineum]
MEGVDRLNELKDEMLVNNIMSRLDCTTKEVIQTTATISKRWKSLWTSLPHFFFSNVEVDLKYSISYKEFVIFAEEIFRGLSKSLGHVENITFGDHCSELLFCLKSGSDTSNDDRAENGDCEEQIASSD